MTKTVMKTPGGDAVIKKALVRQEENTKELASAK